MTFRRLSTSVLSLLISSVSAGVLFAAGGTSVVATKGQPAHVSNAWPEGVGDIVNDPLRSTGWNSWFTEWPNDVNQYAYEVKTTADVNQLLKKLAAIKAPLRQVRLSYLKEPASLGWVTRLDAGNGVPVIFSIGDQDRIDQWFKQVRKPFGVMEFNAAPIAVPPTITIFVQNEAIKLDDLKIPDGITVEAGYVPTGFHRSNTTLEATMEKNAERQAQLAAARKKERDALDPASLKVADAIDAFVEKRAKPKSTR